MGLSSAADLKISVGSEANSSTLSGCKRLSEPVLVEVIHDYSQETGRCSIGGDLAAEGGYLAGPLKAGRE